MDPVKVSIVLYIDEPVSNDIDELTDLVTNAVEDVIGRYDYVVTDVGLSFEIDDV